MGLPSATVDPNIHRKRGEEKKRGVSPERVPSTMIFNTHGKA